MFYKLRFTFKFTGRNLIRQFRESVKGEINRKRKEARKGSEREIQRNRMKETPSLYRLRYLLFVRPKLLTLSIS
jgi:hypothetical protein